MDSSSMSAGTLRKQIAETEAQLNKLREQLSQVEALAKDKHENPVTQKWPLSQEEYKRYGRQMIIPSIGLKGQLRLKDAKVLIIGAGGLGCPAAAYIAGAGVGTIGLVDGDEVEVSNLHRQIAHSTTRVGWKKVHSAVHYLKELNPLPNYIAHPTHINPQIAASIIGEYDLVLDCTDNPASRYLISDTCVLLSKPLISASALRTDGQLIVLNSPPDHGPCYRCVFPKPPPAESVVACSDGGILGPVVGVMGVLQAVEAIKLISQGLQREVLEGEKNEASMLLFSATSPQPFRTVRMRSPRKDCIACSETATLTPESPTSGSLDYVLFCGLPSPVKLLETNKRIEAAEYEKVRSKGEAHVLLDVREKVQFDMCHLEGSVNVPFSIIQRNGNWMEDLAMNDKSIFVVCRLGNDSQVVAKKLLDASGESETSRFIGDIRGGLKAWKEQVDKSWPEY